MTSGWKRNDGEVLCAVLLVPKQVIRYSHTQMLIPKSSDQNRIRLLARRFRFCGLESIGSKHRRHTSYIRPRPRSPAMRNASVNVTVNDTVVTLP
jgi:hypothetical protein